MFQGKWSAIFQGFPDGTSALKELRIEEPKEEAIRKREEEKGETTRVRSPLVTGAQMVRGRKRVRGFNWQDSMRVRGERDHVWEREEG
jgi:hypothetical protein